MADGRTIYKRRYKKPNPEYYITLLMYRDKQGHIEEETASLTAEEQRDFGSFLEKFGFYYTYRDGKYYILNNDGKETGEFYDLHVERYYTDKEKGDDTRTTEDQER